MMFEVWSAFLMGKGEARSFSGSLSLSKYSVNAVDLGARINDGSGLESVQGCWGNNDQDGNIQGVIP